MSENTKEKEPDKLDRYTAFGAAVAALSITVAIASVHWDGHLYGRQGCVELQEAAGQVYKVDTCTGEATLLSDK